MISRIGTKAGNGPSFNPDISDDGRFVTFNSLATDLDPLIIDDNTQREVLVHDRDTDTDGVFDEAGATLTIVLSRSDDGTTGTTVITGDLGFPTAVFRPRISGDGKYVAFVTGAIDLDLDDPTPLDPPLMDGNSFFGNVIKARTDGKLLSLVDIDYTLTESVGGVNPSIDGKGSFVAFVGDPTNIPTGLLDPA